MVKRQLFPKLSELVLPDVDLQERGVSQSFLTSFMSCRMRTMISLNGWKGPKNQYVGMGELFHKILELSYTWMASGKEWSEEVLVDQIIHHACIEHRANSLAGTTSDYTARKVEVDIELCKMLVPIYFQVYDDDINKKFLQMEAYFDVPFEGIKLHGYRDAIFRDWGNNWWIMEHKTKSRIDSEPTLLMKLSFDFQNLFYILCSQMETGKRFSGVLYNIIRKPEVKDDNIAFIPDIQKKVLKDLSHYFIRYELVYTKEQVSQFEKELRVKVGDLKAFISGKVPCVKNEVACDRPYKCDYLEACSSGSLKGYIKREEEQLTQP